MNAKFCNTCHELKSLDAFEPAPKMKDGYRGKCKSCKYYERVSDPERLQRKKDAHRRWKIKALYGITEEEYDSMLAAQDGKCAICKNEDSRGTRLAVDHNHETGKARALLGRNCNLVIGNAKENPEILLAAVEYLNEQEVPKTL